MAASTRRARTSSRTRSWPHPTIDPGWAPLFLTARGLVAETGSPMAHGPTVAREYGIPAVICVRDATQLITTEQLITVHGGSGTVVLADARSRHEVA